MPVTLGSRIVVHQITESGQWAPELLGITHLLLERSRLSCAVGAYDKVANIPVSSVLPTDVQNIAHEPITDILYTVLATVNMLRSFTMTPVELRERPTLSIWASLFGTLAQACSKDSVLITDAPFLLPRTITMDQTDNPKFEGRATILISSYISPQCIQVEDMDIKDSPGSDQESSSSESTSPKTHFVSLDCPFDGHILPGSGRRIDCVLPVICVANQDNIQALVISTVYQRYAWGISLPVVGISIENADVVATVIIGWISDGEHTENLELPIVHLASSSKTVPHSKLGVFDLSDPVSALHFSHFILGLRDQFSDIVANAKLQRADVCWRLDHLLAGSFGDPHELVSLDWRDRIERWLEDINSCSIDSENQSHGTMANRYPKSECSTAHSVPGARSQNNAACVKSPSQSHSSDLESMISFPPSSYSISAFVRLEDTLLDGKPGIEQWLWERRTILAAYVKMNRVHNPAEEQVNEMIDHFTHILELALPDHWRMMNRGTTDIPCDNVFRDLFDLLFVQCKTYLADCADPVPVLADDEFALFSSRLSIFFAAVSEARHQIRTSEALTETKMREPFDLLLNLFWCNKETTISNSYFQDCDIQFVKNKAIEGLLYDSDQAYLCDDITSKQRSSLSRDAPIVVRQALTAKLNIMSDKNISSLRHSYPELNTEDRSAEPTHGLADGLAMTRVIIDSDSGSTATEMLLPRLVVKYQESKAHDTKSAFRQCQMCCVSIVEFLASIGIVDFPVYGLMVSGTHVSILMAWHSTKQMKFAKNSKFKPPGFNVIIDENLVSLDIAEPLDAYHFAIFIHRIFLAGSQLVDLLKSKELKEIPKSERLLLSHKLISEL